MLALESTLSSSDAVEVVSGAMPAVGSCSALAVPGWITPLVFAG